MLFIFIIILFFNCIFSQDFIQKPDIIQFGEYTNLICVLNSTNYLDLFEKYYFGWYYINKNNSNNLIYNMQNDEIKLKIFNIDNKIILQIKNITKDYKKYKFYCSYHNYAMNKTYKNKLNNLTFFNPLYLKNIKIKYFSNNININFKKIFPIPKCFVKINNESIFPENNIQNKTLDYLYSQVNLSMEINCFNKIKIICNLLNQTITIDSKNNTCIYDNLINLIIIILIILFLILSIILIIFIYFKRKELNKKKEILYSLIHKIKK